MMYQRQTLKAENSNLLPSGPRGRGEVKGTNRSLIVFATVLLSCLAGAGRVAAQELVLSGQRSTPNNRAVINMAGMANVERLYRLTNWTSSRKAVGPPMPLADLGGDGVRTQRLAGISGFMGGGSGGGTAGGSAGSPWPEAAAPAPPPLIQPSPAPAISFPGLGDNNTVIPPDTHGAVGPNHVMTTLNSEVRVQDRNGNILTTVSLNGFWQAVGGPQAFDPKCLYDPYGQRFIFTAGADGLTDRSSILIAVSQTSDPTGNWYLYRVDADPGNLTWADYPSVGFNKDWIVVTANMFAVNLIDQFAHQYFGANVYVFNKTNLYANGSGAFTLIKDTSLKGFTLVPAVTHDSELSTMYLVQVDNLWNSNGDWFYTYGLGVNRLQISSITGPIGGEVLRLAEAYTPSTDWWWSIDFQFLLGGSGPQFGLPFFGIDLGDTRIQNVVYRNGSLWATHTIFLPNDDFLNTFILTAPYHSAVQWWQMTPQGQVLQNGRLEDDTGITSYAYPSLAVNRCDDVMIGYSKFSTNQFASANYSFRFATDPPNTLRADTVLKAGEGPYFKTFGFGLLLANRWGDYSATMVDPVNDIDMWTIQEYAAAPVGTNIFGTNTTITNLFFNTESRWGTWWGKIDVVGGNSNRILFASGSYTVNEATPGFATISIINAGGLPGSVEYATSDGTARAGVDYEQANGTLFFAAGQTTTNFTVRILDNAEINSNKTVNLQLLNPQGGAVLGCASTAVLTIEDDETLTQPNIAGEFTFSTYLNYGFPYFATENETRPWDFCGGNVQSIIQPDRNAPGVIVTVVRTNGNTGRVLVDFSTEPGGFATPGVDYFPTNGTLVFDDYQNSANFVVPIGSDSTFLFVNAVFSKWVRVVLSNPRPAPEEEENRPGVIRPKLGNGAESGILVWETNDGFLTGNPPNFTINSWFNIERANYRVDEYAAPGSKALRALNIDVTLYPLGGPGSVHLIVSSLGLVGAGTQFFYPPLYPLWNRDPINTPKLVLNAGSDHAWAFEGQNTAPPLPPPFAFPMVWPNSVNTDPALTTITNYSDMWSTNITVAFGAGQCRRSVTIYITNDDLVEFNEEFTVALVGPASPNAVGPGLVSTVTILADDPPAGALDREWNPDFAPPDFRLTPGANNMVSAVAVQQDGKTVLVGDFDRVNAQMRNYVARMNFDGSLDTTFQPSGGADSFVSSVQLYPTNSVHSGKILIAGGFNSYNSQERHGIARLLPNGSLDTTFNPGNGVNGPIRAMVRLPDDRIIIAGDFTEYNDVVRNGFARLEPNGALDLSFDAGAGVDGIVWTLALTTNSDLLVGGDFLTINGQSAGRIARLRGINGAVDPGFNAGLGANGPVYALTIQTNGQVLVGGNFSEVDTRPISRVARLNPDGTLDLSFDPGTGPDDAVFALTLQPDGKVFLGGLFTSYNGTRRVGLARVRWDGTLDTTFMDTAYNQFAGLINDFSFEPPNFVNSIAVQADGNLMIGGSFTKVGGNPSVNTPLRNTWTVFTRADKRSRYNIARILGGVTPGPGNASFAAPEYYVDENGGTAYMQVVRTDGNLGTLTALSAPTDRLATNGVDYISNIVTTVWPEMYYQTNLLESDPTNWAPFAVGLIDPLYVRVPLIDDNLREGDEVVDMKFLRPGGSITLGGEYIPVGGALGRTSARLTIADNEFDRGVLSFASPQFMVNESNREAVITVIRTGGSQGTLTVDYFTTTNTLSPRATPVRGVVGDYTPKSGHLTFLASQTSLTFSISLVDDTEAEFDENIGLVLTNASFGALPGGLPTSTATATLTIIDNDYSPGRINFGSSSYTNAEADGVATIPVTRSGGSSGMVSARYETTGGTGIDGVDYTRTTGTLTWDDGDTATKFINVPLLLDNNVDGNKTIGLRLFEPMVAGSPSTNLLGFRSTATIYVRDSDAFGSVAFNQPFYQADENGGVISITVARLGGIAGSGSIDYTIVAGTGRPGIDYTPASGRLNFASGQFSATFDITLLDDNQPDGNKAVTLVLSNPINLGLGTPSEVTLTIVDNESFNEPAGANDTALLESTSVNGHINAMVLHPNGNLSIAGDFTQVNNVNRRGLARLMTNGVLDTTFDPGSGADDAIRTLALQPDGKLLIGGFFTHVIGTNRSRIARLNIDGSLDASFNPGSGADNPVYAIVLQPDQKILVGGNFNRLRGTNSPGIIRLNTNGTVDASFNVGAGVNGSVFAIAVQGDGKVLIGGDFSQVNGVPRAGLARLNRNGSLDLSFDIGTGFNGPVRALLVQPDGRSVAGGTFTIVNGLPRNSLARLNSNGSVDTAFLDGLSGADNSVYALALQVDRKLIVAGDFGRFNDVSRGRITRLNTDGSTDTSINFGSGANAFITSTLVQPDRKIVLAGGFTTYDDVPRLRIARIHGGAIGGFGAITFSRGEFLVSENGGEATISVKRRGGTAGTVSANFNTADGTAINGTDYVSTNGTLVFPPGQTIRSFTVRILDNGMTNDNRTVNLALSGYAGGATSGPQPTARLVILNDEGAVGFSADTFSVNENAVSGSATITVRRSLSTNDTLVVSYATVPGGTATAGVDYFPTNGFLTFLPGETSKNFNVRVINDTNIEQNETVLLNLSAPFSDSGSSTFLSQSNATLILVEDDFGPGRVYFERSSVSVNEDGTNVLLTVIRTNGSTDLISVSYRTFDISASSGSDFVGTNSVIAFADGETRKTASITILNDNVSENTEAFSVELFNPTGGATLGTPSVATVNIIDNDTNLIVGAGAFLISESGPVNSFIDPGETVTVSLGLRNVGNTATSNLIATLQQNGNLLPAAPVNQSYGALLPGGDAVFRNYTFTAIGSSGLRLVAALSLVDGAQSYGVVSFSFTLGGASTNTFCNNTNTPIVLNDSGSASIYPSTLTVSNVGGQITKLIVTLDRFSHNFPDDVDILLESPNGLTAMVMSDAGGRNPVNNVVLNFDDNAASPIPDTNVIVSGTYRSANYANGSGFGDTFPPPAPQPIAGGFSPYTNTALSVFAGSNPNGLWKLYVFDDSAGDSGSLAGWCLKVVTGDSLISGTDLVLAGQDNPDPVIVGADLTYTYWITNRGPIAATSVAFNSPVTPKTTFVSASAAIGAPSLVDSSVVHTIASLAPGASTWVQYVVRGSKSGPITNTASVQAAQGDFNPANNTLVLTTDVLAPALTATRNGADVTLSWPASATGFVLQESDDLLAPVWTTVTVQPTIVGNQKRVTLRAQGACKNYRLRKP